MNYRVVLLFNFWKKLLFSIMAMLVCIPSTVFTYPLSSHHHNTCYPPIFNASVGSLIHAMLCSGAGQKLVFEVMVLKVHSKGRKDNLWRMHLEKDLPGKLL